MKKRKGKYIWFVKRLLIIALLLSFLCIVRAQECTQETQPKLTMPLSLKLYEGQNYYYKIPVKSQNNLIFSWAPVNSSLKNFKLNSSTGEINFTPKKSDVGFHKLIILAVDESECFDTKLVTLIVYDKPLITSYSPLSGEPSVDEGSYIKFNINSSTEIETANSYRYEWHVDGKLIGIEKEFLYSPTFNDAGMHNITVIITDINSMRISHYWNVNVKNVNRPPYLKTQLPDLIISPKKEITLYNLNDYFNDLDNDLLKFDYNFIVDENTTKYSELYDIEIDEQGDVTFTSRMNVSYTDYVRFYATDPYGKTGPSNIFKLRIITTKDKFEFFQPVNKICEVQVVCSEWSECLPTGVRIRECHDKNNCNEKNETTLDIEECDFNATCFDGIKNQAETGVDCGGPCLPCPTCEDGIKNQGETDVDCGGPCTACPSCNDSIKNQDETDIDCGGSFCRVCEDGRFCKLHSDCLSFNCINNTCMNPTCHDFRKNQNESGIDCGGPCEACPTCTDGILNQAESGIDCGGPCKACATCDDGIKNQNEFLADCGGPCRACTLQVILTNWYIVFLALLFVALSGVIFLYLRKKYLNNEVDYLFKANQKLMFVFRSHNDEKRQISDNALNSLQNLKSRIHTTENDEQLSNEFHDIIKNYFKQLLLLDDAFTIGVLKRTLDSTIKNPFLRKIILILYERTLTLGHSVLFKLELNEKTDEAISIIEKLKLSL
ncbi:hypothetical protein JXB41_03825 [Candidatus Woesearchaeota archaeon]|nr:hypothetical protein [Candidatus Woesearchaeota archaeon]